MLARPESSVARNPFTMMRRMFDDMERLFGGESMGLDELEGALDVARPLPSGLWAPKIDVREKDGKLLVRADLPGLKGNEVQVNVDNDMLTISGERRDEYEGENAGVYRRERSYGCFERRIALPKSVDPNAIDARFEDGVLQITAPLPQRGSRGRRIDVKSSSGTLGREDPSKQKH
jgi:HSP20 family protein